MCCCRKPRRSAARSIIFQWTAILRAVSAHTSYHWVYRQGIQPWLVADLLILRPRCRAPLTSCYENIVRHLDSLGMSHGRQGASQRHARAMLGRLENEKIESIFQSGLHEFITAFHRRQCASRIRDPPSNIWREAKSELKQAEGALAIPVEQSALEARRTHAIEHPPRNAPPLRPTGEIGDPEPAPDATATMKAQHVVHWRIDVDVECRLKASQDASATSCTASARMAPLRWSR